MKTVEIPANVKSRIQRWINDLDGRSHYNNTFRYGDYEILAEVEVDECFDYINVDVWVFLNGDEVPFEGLSTTELEDNYIEVLYYSREQGQAMKDTYNSLR